MSLALAQEYFYLQVFFMVLAASVFVSGFRANSLTFLLIGSLLFSRFFLENYQYEWSPIGQLALGHFFIALVMFFAVKGTKNLWLWCFPALIFLQGVLDVSFLAFEYSKSNYAYPHNALALIQMSTFIVLAYECRKVPVIKDDPIEELISRLTRNWASVLPHWKSTHEA